MIKATRVKIPVDKPEETLDLSDQIIEKDTADGVDSSLAGVIDMAAFALKVTDAKAKRKEADKKSGTAQKKYELASNKCGYGKGEQKGDKNTVVWFVRQVRDLLLVIHDGNEETLSEYGFNVVITNTGARKKSRAARLRANGGEAAAPAAKAAPAKATKASSAKSGGAKASSGKGKAAAKADKADAADKAE